MRQGLIGVVTRVGIDSKRLFCDLQKLAPASAGPGGFEPGERATLEVGSGVVLGALGLGLQFGRWPAWAAVLAVGGYFAWVALYSEVTVQARRHRPNTQPLVKRVA